MRIAVDIFPTDQTINPVEFAKAAEDLGFESIWFPEHSHIPTSRLSPWGGYEGAPPLPEFYQRTYDPFVALGACSAATTTIKLATGICLVAQRDPIHTAKEVASVDALSNGRMIVGIGYGWNKEEMAQHGTQYGQRRALLRDRILAMKALWTQDEASYAGEFVQIEPSWAWPKPAQRPHPPIVLGGSAGPKTAQHVAEFGDGWMPIGGRGLKTGWDDVRRACDDIGRDPQSVELGVSTRHRTKPSSPISPGSGLLGRCSPCPKVHATRCSPSSSGRHHSSTPCARRDTDAAAIAFVVVTPTPVKCRARWRSSGPRRCRSVRRTP